MGALEISLLTLMVLVVLAGVVRLTGLRRTRDELAARDRAISELDAKIAAEVAEARHWRAKTEEARDVLAAMEAKVKADLMAALPSGSGDPAGAPASQDRAAGTAETDTKATSKQGSVNS